MREVQYWASALFFAIFSFSVMIGLSIVIEGGSNMNKMTKMDARIRANKEENIGLAMTLSGIAGSVLSYFVKNKIVSCLLGIAGATAAVGGVYVSAHGEGVKDGLDWTADNGENI